MVWSEEAAWESHDCFDFLDFQKFISFREGFGLYLKKQDKHKKITHQERNQLVLRINMAAFGFWVTHFSTSKCCFVWSRKMQQE